jgi:hypothetical protein
MTTLQTIGGAPVLDHPERPAEGPGIHDLLSRLRDAAGRLVAFSVPKLLLREAALMIERLDRDRGHHATEVARLTAELARERLAVRRP